MGGWNSFLLFVGGLGILIFAFFSVVSGFSKAFREQDKSSSIQADKVKKKQQDIMEETEEKRKAMMENLQQKIRDNQRRP